MSDAVLASSARRSGVARETFGALSREFHSNRVFYTILAVWLTYTASSAILRKDGFIAELAEYGGRAIRAGFILGCAAVIVAAIRVLLTRPENPLKTMIISIVDLLPGRMVARYAYGFAVFAVF